MMTARTLTIFVRVLGASVAAGLLFLGCVYGVSEWKMRRSYDAPLTPLRAANPADPVAGMHMAKVVGCWAGCHGRVGEGGYEEIDGIHRSAAPTLSEVLPQYSDEELVRLIRYGVKRDGRSAIGMISYSTWPLGDQDLINIIAHLRAQPLLPPVPRSHEFTLRGRWLMVTGQWGLTPSWSTGHCRAGASCREVRHSSAAVTWRALSAPRVMAWISAAACSKEALRSPSWPGTRRNSSATCCAPPGPLVDATCRP
jgi:hypothetical protein